MGRETDHPRRLDGRGTRTIVYKPPVSCRAFALIVAHSLMSTPTDRRIRYGAMWWLNTDGEKGRMYPSAPTTSYTAQVSSRTTHTTPKRKMCVLCGQPRSAGPLHGCHSRPLCLQGAGGNYIWIEPTLDLVVVVRWCGDFKGFTEAVMAALEPAPAKL